MVQPRSAENKIPQLFSRVANKFPVTSRSQNTNQLNNIKKYFNQFMISPKNYLLVSNLKHIMNIYLKIALHLIQYHMMKLR